MKFLFSIVFFTSFLFAGDVVDIYRKSGIKEVQKYIEEQLKSEKYWLERLQKVETDYGFYENLNYLLFCNKHLKDFKVFKVDNNQFKFMNNSKAYVGEKGDKEKEGDLKTPVGVYELTQKLLKLDDFYGPLAFVTSYPNTYDSVKDKNGHGIWIHGLPSDINKRDNNTKGCIALDNEYLKNLDKEIDYQKSLLIIAEDGLQKVEKEDLSIILSGLFKWREAWTDNKLDVYLSFYNKDFKRNDKMSFEDFKVYKKKVFDKNEVKTIEFSNINISPYPNLYNEKIFLIKFDENYQAPSYKFQGSKELYVKIINKNISIILEK